jgi:hypothetical protein
VSHTWIEANKIQLDEEGKLIPTKIEVVHLIIVLGVLFFHAYLDLEPGNFQKEEVIESPQDEYDKILFLIESLPLQLQFGTRFIAFFF